MSINKWIIVLLLSVLILLSSFFYAVAQIELTPRVPQYLNNMKK